MLSVTARRTQEPPNRCPRRMYTPRLCTTPRAQVSGGAAGPCAWQGQPVPPSHPKGPAKGSPASPSPPRCLLLALPRPASETGVAATATMRRAALQAISPHPPP